MASPLVAFGLLLSFGIFVDAGSSKDYKDQHCTDPRTMQKHAAYSEWADAYSCTRHRCQPGGRNLAIYTVGCKRVEAPESAIECEEVVEDTNMQFPFCCTRLRCLVVVRGEVWTRVLGQPWETLPAAPWSHMYKMKRPPPSEFDSKSSKDGPIYELGDDGMVSGNMRSKSEGRKKGREDPDCDDSRRNADRPTDIILALETKSEHQQDKSDLEGPMYNIDDTKNSRKADGDCEGGDCKVPDIVIALETKRERPSQEKRKRPRSLESENRYFEEVDDKHKEEDRKSRYERADDTEETATEKTADEQKQQPEAPDMKWNAEISAEVDNAIKEHQSSELDQKEERPSKLQDLVDAIGTRMRDIENVVQKMSERVQKEDVGSGEKRAQSDKDSGKENNERKKQKKKPNPDGENYKRFQTKKTSKKLKKTTEDHDILIEDEQNGYYSDAVNSIMRRNNDQNKEPVRPMYMAPIENRRKSHHKLTTSEERKEDKKEEKRHKKRSQKKKKHHEHHKKHHDKRRKNSIEVDRYVVSIEDSSGSNVVL